MPDWLVRHLETIGAMGNDRIGRRIRATRCRHCACPILVGLDSDRCAWVARATPSPLSPLGEAVAILNGQATYALHVGAGMAELQIRDRWQIAGCPAATRFDVLAAHVCGAGPLPAAPTVTRLSVPRPEQPPY